MARNHKPAMITVKGLVILAAVVVVLGMGVLATLHVRWRVLSARNLAAGQAAFDKQDWDNAREHLQEYLRTNPGDAETLKKYAEACLSCRPMNAKNVQAGIGAYRRVMCLQPDDEELHEKLAMLYAGLRNFSELAHVARERLEQTPDDCKAPISLGEALLALGKPEEAREGLLAFIKRIEPLDEKYVEHAQACGIMSTIAARGESEQAGTEALAWLDRAVKYDGKCVEALVYRVRFYRTGRKVPGMTKEKMQADARRDLELADELGTDNPRIRLVLSAEWMSHERFDRAAAELKAVENLDETALREYFYDPNDWVTARFLQAAKLAMRMGAAAEDTDASSRIAAEGAALADNVLAVLTGPRSRARVLSQATRLYVLAGRTSDARRCLDEYLEAQKLNVARPKSSRGIGYLQAMVAASEDRPYRVIDVLEPEAVRDPSRPGLWRLLAKAYSRTDQTRRSVRSLICEGAAPGAGRGGPISADWPRCARDDLATFPRPRRPGPTRWPRRYYSLAAP